MTALLACLAALSLLVASAGAQAATVKLRCAGRGGRNEDSAGTVLCAASPSKGRTIAGVVRDDAGKPVAARLTITYSSWTPVGTDSFTIRPRTTRELTARSDGTFSFRSTTATKESIRVDVVADATLGVTGGAFAQTDVSRALVVKLAKLGGGTVRFTVTGTTHGPIKLYVLDESGYPLPGMKPKTLDGKHRATFNLGSLRGRFTYFIDVGVYNDLFWDAGRPTFRL